MKRIRLSALLPVAFAFAASPLFAENASGSGRGTRVVRRPAADQPAQLAPKATGISYSVQVNVVTRVQGTSFFRTAIDITNNTTQTDPITATYQYAYRFNGAMQYTAAETIGLLPIQNFHTDDIIQYLGAQGLLLPGADQVSFGTLLVTFDNLPSKIGWEGTVTARTYSPYDQSNPALGTVAIAYPGSLFFESATGTLLGTIRDTRSAPTAAGALRTNIGITNTDLFGVGPVSVQLSFYDVTEGSPTNGQRVGNFIDLNNLQAGEVTQVNDAFSSALIPTSVDSCIVFADVTAGGIGPDPPTIEGYIVILDGGTQDGAFFEMKCAAGCGL